MDTLENRKGFLPVSGIELREERRRLLNVERHALCFSTDIIRVIKSGRTAWVGHVARMGERRGAYWVLVEKPGRKRPPGRPRRLWEDNIKIDLF